MPLDPKNTDYQEILDDVIKNGSLCFVGDVPEFIQEAADAKQFDNQVEQYIYSKARLEKYILSEGQQEVVTIRNIGPGYPDETTGEITYEKETIVVQPAIDPLPATVMITITNPEDPEGPVIEQEIKNPEIEKDEQEREEAQTVIDNTPDAVKEHVDNE